MFNYRDVLSLLDHVETVLYLYDEELRIKVFNKATADTFKKVTGHKLETGAKFLDYISEADKKVLMPKFVDGLEGKHQNFTFTMPIGEETLYFKLNINPVPSENGGKMASCSSQIITEELNDKISLLRSEANLTALIENASDSVWSVDKNIKILTANSLFVEQFNEAFNHRLQVGDCPLDYLPPPLSRMWRERYLRCLEGEHFSVIDHYDFEDLPQYVEISYNPIKIGNKTEGVSCFTRDITQLKLSESALKEAIATKDKFFSIIAHDLKGPIANIRELTRLLTIDDPNTTAHERNRTISYLAQTTNSVKYLLDNLLHWARSQQDLITLKPESIGLKDFVDQTIEAYLTSAQLKNINVENKISSEIVIKGDKQTLGIVVANLFNNATKYTKPTGKIFLEAEHSNDKIKFIVRDTGIGIDKQTIQQVLENQDVRSTPGTNNEKGTGLGLIISKEFIKNNGGMLEIESKKGEGSVFSFLLSKS